MTEPKLSPLRSALRFPTQILIADGTLFVAVIEGRVVGCGAWSKRQKLYTGSERQESGSAWLDPSKEPARIRAFFVDPDFARQGIARRLFRACQDDAVREGFKRFELMATLPGVPLYESLGFVADEAVDLDLVDGTKLPAVHMEISLVE